MAKAKKKASKKKVGKSKAPKKIVARRAKSARVGKVGFSAEQVRHIRARCYLRHNGKKVPGKSNDLSQLELAKEYGCSTRTIYAIAKREAYGEVTDA